MPSLGVPCIEQSGEDWHFANGPRIAELREAKLASLRFRVSPNAGRRPGEAMSFLSEEIVAEFNIPEAPPVSANAYGGDLIDMIEGNPGKLFLDLGAGLRQIYFPNVVNTEIYPSYSTDVICVGEHLPFEDEQFDYVFAFAVLEHTRRPWEVAREMIRVLKPGGTVIVDWPFLQALHGYPHHYFNATPEGNRSLFEADCDIVSLDVRPNQAPIYSLYWFLANWRAGLPPDDLPAFDALTIGGLLSQPPDRHMTAPYCRNLKADAQRIIAAGTTLVGVKRPTSNGKAAPREQVGAPSRNGPQPLPAVSAKQEELELLRQQNRDLRQQLQMVLGSTSWRLLAPIRAVVNALRRH